MPRQGRAAKRQGQPLGGRVPVPPQVIHITIALSSSSKVTPPNKCKVLLDEGKNYLALRITCQRRSVDSYENQKSSSEYHLRPKGGRPCTHPEPYSNTALNHCYKTPYQISWAGTQFLRASACCDPLAWQSSKIILFYFILNAVSKIQFSTGTQRPTFQQHLV